MRWNEPDYVNNGVHQEAQRVADLTQILPKYKFETFNRRDNL